MKPLQTNFKGSSQRRYRHKKDYTFYNEEGKSISTLKIDVKLTEEQLINELAEFKELCGASSCYITWTARDGTCKEEVPI